MYNVDHILSSTKQHFDKFVHDLVKYKLDNATGSSFRKIFLGVYKDGILIYSGHNTYNECGIKIASNPKSNWSLGDQDSRYEGNPHPRLENGEWVTVWDGYHLRQIKPGPWENKVREVLQYYIDQYNAKVEVERQKREEARVEAQLKLAQKEQELINNWL